MRDAIKNCLSIIASLGAESRFACCEGAHVHYACAGDGDVLVMLHGFGAWAYGWRNQIAALRDKFRVIAVDLKGFGLSTRSLRTSYSVEAHAKAVMCILEREGIDRATVVGNSFGGTVALTMALMSRERVNALILLGTPFRIKLPKLPPMLFTPLIGPMLAKRRLFNECGVKDTMRYNYANQSIITEESIKAYLAPLHIRGTANAWVKMLRQINGFDMSHRLPQIGQPSLLIWGEFDKTVPVPVGEELCGRLQNACLKVLRNAGHAPHEECPELVNKLICEFIATT
ncbi:MAG: alpha/beta hydrolase [Armatimonadota bacterium]|nr:alpha/beta hydrolase [Armatimonadota bacterium]MCX7776767.1 alpha/beta hydrolase [Armatimonadota bacterium]MDW8024564.1 alpha/beta hydrolase [Armatimonadota bacterium]